MRMIEHARSDLVKRVSISTNFKELLTNLAKRTDEFTGKTEVPEIYQAMIIQERIEAIQKESTDTRNRELLRRLHEGHQEAVHLQEEEQENPPQPKPSIRTIKVLKVDVDRRRKVTQSGS